MKLRFFGDSWYWSWFYDDRSFKSKKVRSVISHTSGFPAIEAYANRLGIQCIHHNRPGSDFYQVVSTIKSTNDHVGIDYNVVLFSSLFRGKGSVIENGNVFEYFCVKDYDQFVKKWEYDVLMLLKEIQNWALEHNQIVLLVGAQSTLSKDLFYKLPNTGNMHLVTECITSQIVKDQSVIHSLYKTLHENENFGIFKLSRDISSLADKSWDRRLINHIYEDQKRWSEVIVENSYLCKPDDYHLNTTGALYLLDLLLYKIEKLNGEKNGSDNL